MPFRSISQIATAASLSLALPASASAESWREVQRSPDYPAAVLMIDTASIKRDGHKISYRVQWFYETTIDSHGTTREISEYDASCAHLNYMIVRMMFFNGTTLTSDLRPQKPEDYINYTFTPQTLGMDSRDMACGTLAYRSGMIANPAIHAQDYFLELNEGN